MISNYITKFRIFNCRTALNFYLSIFYDIVAPTITFHSIFLLILI